MSVGVADGPLPIADIIGAFVAIVAIGILAMEWPEIEKKWPEIEKAFEKCFSNISTDISKAFSKLKVKVQDKYYSLQFQNFSKHYAKHAKEFKDMKGGTGKKPSKKEYYNMAKSFLKTPRKELQADGIYLCEVSIPNKAIAAVYKSEILAHLLQIDGFNG